MVRQLTTGFLMLITTLLLCTGAQAQNVEASIDRDELIRGETVTLTLRVFGQQGGVQMDLSPIEENFDILVTRTSSQMRSVNGRTESWTDYILTLFPRTTGTLEIPALNIGSQTTQAMQVEVQPQTQNSISAGQTLFLEATINKESVFVQEQLLFDIRLYYTINGIRNPQFTELEMDDAVIQMIGSANQYEKLIDGVRYGVYEKKYVIFPQRSGSLTIPDIVFRGEVADGSSSFVFRNLNTRTITAFAEGHEIEVKERPATFPDSTWLPASNISIREEWSQDVTDLQVGDSVTRKITVTANGLDGAALPPLQVPAISRFNTYPQPPEIERTFIDGNIVGTRTETSTVVAIESGSVEIPEISLPWWDVETEEIMTATVPARFVRVAPAPGTEPVTPDNEMETTGESQNADAGDITAANLADGDDLVTTARPSIWIVALAVLVTAGLMLAWVFSRRRRPDPAATPVTRKPTSDAYRDDIDSSHETAAFNKLQQACNEQDVSKVRLALIAWGRQYYQDSRLYTLDDLFARSADPQIRKLATHLISSVYASEDQQASLTAADFKALADAVSNLRRQQQKSRKAELKLADYQLPPLYKS